MAGNIYYIIYDTMGLRKILGNAAGLKASLNFYTFAIRLLGYISYFLR